MTRTIDSFSGEFAFLSNFWRSPLTFCVHGRTLLAPSVEHAFQASKCIYSSRPDMALELVAADTPSAAKRLGRAVPLDVDDWNRARDGVMFRLLLTKFAFGSQLAARLLATGDAQLVEGNTWGDRYWGVCRGEGQNRLGLLLVDVRDVLRLGFSPLAIPPELAPHRDVVAHD